MNLYVYILPLNTYVVLNVFKLYNINRHNTIADCSYIIFLKVLVDQLQKLLSEVHVLQVSCVLPLSFTIFATPQYKSDQIHLNKVV